MAFQGWHDNSLYYAAANILPSLRPRIRALPIEQQWAVVEDLTLLNGCHYFLACHPERAKRILIDFSANGWLNYIPVRHPYLEMVEDPADEPDFAGKLKRGAMELRYTPAEAVLLSNTDGKRTIEEIIASPAFGSHGLEQRREFANKVFKRMWELGHIFILNQNNRADVVSHL